jgi:hypothetical protein
MDAILAGTTAWAIEIGIALALLYLVKREEDKVIKRRKKS